MVWERNAPPEGVRRGPQREPSRWGPRHPSCWRLQCEKLPPCSGGFRIGPFLPLSFRRDQPSARRIGHTPSLAKTQRTTKKGAEGQSPFVPNLSQPLFRRTPRLHAEPLRPTRGNGSRISPPLLAEPPRDLESPARSSRLCERPFRLQLPQSVNKGPPPWPPFRRFFPAATRRHNTGGCSCQKAFNSCGF